MCLASTDCAACSLGRTGATVLGAAAARTDTQESSKFGIEDRDVGVEKLHVEFMKHVEFMNSAVHACMMP